MKAYTCIRCLSTGVPKRRFDRKNLIWRLGCSECGSFVFVTGGVV